MTENHKRVCEKPVQCGMGFQPMNHRQDADATTLHGQGARATSRTPSNVQNERGFANMCDHVLRGITRICHAERSEGPPNAIYRVWEPKHLAHAWE